MKTSLKYHFPPNNVFSLMNGFFLPVLQQVRNQVFLFFFFLPVRQKYWKSCVVVFSLQKKNPTNSFMCQCTILGEEEISKKGSMYSQSSKQKGMTKLVSSSALVKRILSQRNGLEAINWQVTGRSSCLNIWNCPEFCKIYLFYLRSNMYSLVMWSCCWTPGQDKSALEPGLQSPTPVPHGRTKTGERWLSVTQTE